MEREGVEKAGVQCLMSGVQGMEIRGGKPKILKREGGGKMTKENSRPNVWPRLAATSLFQACSRFVAQNQMSERCAYSDGL